MEIVSTLSSWSDAKAFLCSHFPTARDHGDAIAMTWKAVDPALPLIRLRISDGGAQPDAALVVAATLFGENRLGARELLAYGERLAIGGLSLSGDTYVLRQTLLCAGLAPDTLSRTVGLVARCAAQLLRLLAPRPQPTELFAIYA